MSAQHRARRPAVDERTSTNIIVDMGALGWQRTTVIHRRDYADLREPYLSAVKLARAVRVPPKWARVRIERAG